ncbi:MAG: ATP-binding cassette domain-containing protein [Methylophilaceae bacterium]|nr:ATP-binding cassette domain-containing protein [Methylophilaceae bacterium]
MSPFFFTLVRLSQLQTERIDHLALTEILEPYANIEVTQQSASDIKKILRKVMSLMQLPPPKFMTAADAAKTPLLVFHQGLGWGIVRGLNAKGEWVTEWFDVEKRQFKEELIPELGVLVFAKLRLAQPFELGKSPISQLIIKEILSHKSHLLEIIFGTLLINIIALAVSFYSMQVYDRVVPTGALQTLFVLTSGAILAVVFEIVAKHIRSHLQMHLIDEVDARLARAVYTRFLSIRLDQLPASVGVLASQLRGYESVRTFFTAVGTFMMVDLPFVFIFLWVIWLLAPALSVIPLIFLVIAVSLGMFYQHRLNDTIKQVDKLSHFKVGLMVETVEGAETIKSGHGGWRMLSQWMKVTDASRDQELTMKNINEFSAHLTGFFQQAAYVSMVAFGAYLITKGELTMGGLIACSILSGRVLAPVAAIPAQMMQWASTRVAIDGLDRIWRLESDHHDVEQPVILDNIVGNYRFEDVEYTYDKTRSAIRIEHLQIKAGEKIAIIGPVGSGKTTLLRLLSGMYKPAKGKITLQDVDITQLSKPVLAEHVGYLQQDGRLFAGTLRENLILGMLDPGDDVILQAAELTGLKEALLQTHPKGLQLEINEGGTGLSGGQKQLVNLTRIFLRKPTIWLLDEPTASMDQNLQNKVIHALNNTLRAEDTMVVVTHKTELLQLVSRIIVVVNSKVVMDGPTMQVLQQLQQPSAAPAAQEQVA